MIKVFFADRFILLTKPEMVLDRTNVSFFEDRRWLQETINQFENTPSVSHLTIAFADIAALFNEFSKCFKELEASGGVVRNVNGDYLFIYRLDKWDLPKGKREKGESIEENAIREVCEETGLSKLSIVESLLPTYHTYHHKGAFVLKKTNWFLMNYMGHEILRPQTEEYISEVQWLDEKNIATKVKPNTYASIKEVIAQVI